MHLPIGLEVLGCGIALAFVGAVYLGLSFLDTVPGVANRLFLHSGTAERDNMTEPVYYQQVYDAAEELLRARVGVLYLALGFGLQLVGVVLPAVLRPLVFTAVVATVIVLAVVAGNTWLRLRMMTMIRAILGSYTLDHVRDRADFLKSEARVTWEEGRILRLLRTAFSAKLALGRKDSALEGVEDDDD